MPKSLIKDTVGTQTKQKRFAYSVSMNRYYTFWTDEDRANIQAKKLDKQGCHIGKPEYRTINRFIDLLPNNHTRERFEVSYD